MYRTVEEFVTDWNRESENSLRIERALTDASLTQKSDPGGRTLRELGWHLAGMIGSVATAMGLTVDAPARGSEPAATAGQIAIVYEKAARSFSEQVSKTLKDDGLSKEIQLFGRTLTMDMAFQSLMRHQIHHRAQMTVLMRMAGLTVPGIYGPNREESAALKAKQGK
jgi:uncharacterized damage-inducible protein DinB